MPKNRSWTVLCPLFVIVADKGLLCDGILFSYVQATEACSRGCSSAPTDITHNQVFIKTFAGYSYDARPDVKPSTHVLGLLLAPNHISRTNAIARVHVTVLLQQSVHVIE